MRSKERRGKNGSDSRIAAAPAPHSPARYVHMRYLATLNESSKVCLFRLACESILLRDVGVPSFAVQGKEAVLSCDYDLEGQELYAVKWYKNGLEFYRYVHVCT